MKFFEQLIDFLFPPRRDERIVRRAEACAVAALVSPMLVSVSGEMQATALLPFRNPLVRALIHEAKYRGNERAFALLGGALREYLSEWTAEEGFGEICLIPIPLSEARKKERGYNQVEKVLRYAARDVSFSIDTKSLIRLRDTASQTALSGSARRKNMSGAFGAAPGLNSSCTYLLIDDVLTTGATMHAGASALAAAGITRITLLALAH